jgi:hypothetical protein
VAKKRKEEKPKEYTHRQLSHFKKHQRRQRIVLITGIVIIAVVILLPVAGWLASEYIPLHQTMLVINGKKFDVAYYIDTIKIGRLNSPSTDISTLANNAYQAILQGEEIRLGAQKLGYTVSEDEVNKYLKTGSMPQTKAYQGYFGAQLLIQKLQTGYFSANISDTGDQVHALMMLLESDQQASEIRERIVNGGNFTALAKAYALNYYSKNVNDGDFGMHVRDVLTDQISTPFALDYAFSAPVGSLSPPVADNETYKQMGYWLIKIVDRPEEGKVNVQALFVADNVTAQNLRAGLAAGTLSLADTADKYTQYSLSKEKHGDLGVISQSENATYTQTFDNYVFDPASPKGTWSAPIQETELWTRGGSWLVKVLAKEVNAPISAEDKNTLVNKALNSWYSEVSSATDIKVNSDLLTPEIQLWAMERVEKELPASTGT